MDLDDFVSVGSIISTVPAARLMADRIRVEPIAPNFVVKDLLEMVMKVEMK